LGTRNDTTTLCKNLPFYSSAQCIDAAAFLAYAGEPIEAFASWLPFDLSASVRSPAGVVLAHNWSAWTVQDQTLNPL
jgi:hypothetical protein